MSELWERNLYSNCTKKNKKKKIDEATSFCPQIQKRKNTVLDLHPVVDLTGIEPVSESLFIEASPITVIILTFPLSDT